MTTETQAPEGALTDEDRTRALNLAYQFRSHPASRGIDEIEQAGELILSLLAQPVMLNGLTETETDETASVKGLIGDPGTSVNDGALVFARVMEYQGKTRRDVHSPNLTARECIALANYIAASDRASQVQPKGLTSVCHMECDTCIDNGKCAFPGKSAEPARYPHPDEDDAVTLWAEIHRLRAAVQGPDGYATWQEAATAERVRRVAAEKALAAVQAPAPAPEPVAVVESIGPVPGKKFSQPHLLWYVDFPNMAALVKPGDKLYTHPAVPCAAVVAGDERQDIGGHIRAAANVKVAQQADDDTRRLDYLQKTQATISLVPDGRDGNGTRHAFMVGGWHCSVSRDVRASIDAAMGESQPPVQGRES